MKPLIVLATDSLEPSGMGEHMLTLAAGLQPHCDVVLMCTEQGEGGALLRRAARLCQRIKTLDCDRPDLVTAWLARSGAALLHVHAGIGWEGHGLARCGKAAGLPVVRTEHLPYLLTDPVQKAEYRAMLLCVDRRIAVSEAVLRSHSEAGGGKLTLVRNGIEQKSGRPLSAAARQELGLMETDKLLLMVARFTPQKGHAVLLSAVPAVLAHEPHAKFVLVGRGPEQNAIEKRICEAGLERTVEVLGPRDDVPDLLASADLFLLPSHFEGLPLALLEAMAAGVPVVATTIGGTVEAIGGAHPFLVPADDPQALSGAILEALRDAAKRERAAAAAQARFAAHFSVERMARETAATYDALLNTQISQGITA